jgi:hypothetical protein
MVFERMRRFFGTAVRSLDKSSLHCTIQRNDIAFIFVLPDPVIENTTWFPPHVLGTPLVSHVSACELALVSSLGQLSLSR